MNGHRAFGFGLAILFLVAPAWSPPIWAAPAMPRAAGGVRLLEAMEAAPATAVILVRSTRALGGSGHAAGVRVEDPLVGEVEIGKELPIAWEELAASRAPRFQVGDRVLVVLEPLPGHSIWLTRLPDPEERARTLAVAMRGDAFMRSPSLGTVALLEHYLALIPADRAGAAGVGYLAQLAASAEIPLAVDAIRRLGTRADLDAKLTPTTAGALVRALVRDDATAALQNSLVELIDQHRLAAMREPLEALASGDSLAPPVVYAALAQLEGGLSPDRAARLLAQGSESYRRVGARNASGVRAPRDLRGIVRRDPSAAVRIGAIERLVELHGRDSIRTVADALHDSDPVVRATAARELGGLGSAAVPELVRVTEAADLDAARAAIAGLALTGSDEGSTALGEIAANHPDDSVRKLARVALGGDLGHTHD